VTTPQQVRITFGYDALGRRVYKEAKHTRTCWLWDGNTPLHEWTETEKQPQIDLVTWVFEEGGFVPAARLTETSNQSIVTDYLGTPVQMYDAKGEKTWEAELDIYGRVRTFVGRSLSDCPFRYQGQYEDEETGLYYNRFRYYDPSIGSYISQDPIGLAGGNPTLYGYVHDPNSWVDILGLSRRGNQATRVHIEEVKNQFLKDNPGYSHIGGGLNNAGGKVKESYIRPTTLIPGSTKGGSYADLTFESPSGDIVHINTVDKGSYSGMSKREWINANRIKADSNATVITVVKGAKVNPGELDVSGSDIQGKVHYH
jgi:RHS repeat-associated protein